MTNNVDTDHTLVHDVRIRMLRLFRDSSGLMSRKVKTKQLWIRNITYGLKLLNWQILLL